MCYAIPGKLVEINDRIGVVDYFGEKRKVLLDMDEVKIGDYVYAQGGVVISKVSKEEAEETLVYWKDQFFELKKVDAELAKVRAAEDASPNVLAILQKVNLKQELSKEDMIALMKVTDSAELKLIYETANNQRQKEHDNACCVHGIIEFSNYCEHDCLYCGIRASKEQERYRMDVDEIISVAKHAVDEYGFKALVLQSGEDMWYDDEKLVKVVSEIRKMGVLIFVSIGVRTKELYKKLYDAGARAVLLRFETSNKVVFNKTRPGTDLDVRLDLIKYVKSLGYLVATGFLIGLPGETDSDIVDNILLTKELGADMYSFGPLIPAKGTPFSEREIVNKDAVLKVIALSRFVDPVSKILVTSALETLDAGARREGLLAGANSLMVNLTPTKYKQMYTLYEGRPDRDKDIENNIKETTDLLYSIGRAPTDIGL